MLKRSLLLLATAATVAGIGAAIVFLTHNGPPDTTLGTVVGGPPVEWNTPFLAWPQTGDMACETEDGPCHSEDRTPDPSSLGLAQPLRIAGLDVPVGEPGRHESKIGTLVFPDGIHTRTVFRIVNPDTSVYRVIQPRIEFRSLVPGAPPFTEFAADRPPVHGAEPVEAVLVWEVDWAAPGAVMKLADIVVE
jgi:hypothetical protein